MLGMAASYRGTSDSQVCTARTGFKQFMHQHRHLHMSSLPCCGNPSHSRTPHHLPAYLQVSKMLFLHLPSTHPSNFPEIELSPLVQVSHLYRVQVVGTQLNSHLPCACTLSTGCSFVGRGSPIPGLLPQAHGGDHAGGDRQEATGAQWHRRPWQQPGPSRPWSSRDRCMRHRCRDSGEGGLCTGCWAGAGPDHAGPRLQGPRAIRPRAEGTAEVRECGNKVHSKTCPHNAA